MAYYIGRAVQIIGMLELGYALYVGYNQGEWKAELGHLALGSLLFIAGRFLERRFAKA